MNEEYWSALDELVIRNGIEIDRPKGTAHLHFPDLIYLVDYGFILETSTADGQGIDIFRGSGTEPKNRWNSLHVRLY